MGIIWTIISTKSGQCHFVSGITCFMLVTSGEVHEYYRASFLSARDSGAITPRSIVAKLFKNATSHLEEIETIYATR